MARLSDRAFQIVKNEIERRYSDDPEDQIERVILLSRLETMRALKGKPMTRVQIWEVLSDVAPNFDQNVLMDAESVETDSPILGASIGVGAVAMLVAAAIGMEHVTNQSTAETPAQSVPAENPSAKPVGSSPDPAKPKAKMDSRRRSLPQFLTDLLTQPNNASDQSTDSLAKNAGKSLAETAAGKQAAKSGGRINYFETAKGFGWQAALKSQNPPHNHQHWGEAATLWSLALGHLEQVPPTHPRYMEAQAKKALYRQNLQQVQGRQARALNRDSNLQVSARTQSVSAQTKPRTETATPVAMPSTAMPSTAQTPQFSAVPSAAETEDSLEVAKSYGWQAAVASQNAPHPPERWADISRLWQTAILNLNKIEETDARHAEAQQVKTRYQSNLSAIRDRYQQEQAAVQRLQSLQATLSELNNSMTPKATQYSQLEAIVTKLETIPSGTEAHAQAQPLISEAMGQMNAIASNNP